VVSEFLILTVQYDRTAHVTPTLTHRTIMGTVIGELKMSEIKVAVENEKEDYEIDFYFSSDLAETLDGMSNPVYVYRVADEAKRLLPDDRQHRFPSFVVCFEEPSDDDLRAALRSFIA
jgi:hypothetical protein